MEHTGRQSLDDSGGHSPHYGTASSSRIEKPPAIDLEAGKVKCTLPSVLITNWQTKKAQSAEMHNRHAEEGEAAKCTGSTLSRRIRAS